MQNEGATQKILNQGCSITTLILLIIGVGSSKNHCGQVN